MNTLLIIDMIALLPRLEATKNRYKLSQNDPTHFFPTFFPSGVFSFFKMKMNF